MQSKVYTLGYTKLSGDTGCDISRGLLPSGRMIALLVYNPQLTPMLKPTDEDTHSYRTEES